jgi:hypothetical protein
MTVSRSLLLGWYLPLVAGTLPVLLLGFAVSALADRLVFIPWALALAGVYTWLLRQGIEAGWPRGVLAGVLGLLLAVGLAVFAELVARHHEIFDLGFRAVLPGLYHPRATDPLTFAVLAGLPAVAGAGCWALGSLRSPRRRA